MADTSFSTPTRCRAAASCIGCSKKSARRIEWRCSASTRTNTRRLRFSRSIRWARCRRSCIAASSSPKRRRSARISPMRFQKQDSRRRSTIRRAAPTCAGCSSAPDASNPRSSIACWSVRRRRAPMALGYGSYDATLNALEKAVTPGSVRARRTLQRGRRLSRVADRLGHGNESARSAAGVRTLFGALHRAARRSSASPRRRRCLLRRIAFGNLRCAARGL